VSIPTQESDKRGYSESSARRGAVRPEIVAGSSQKSHAFMLSAPWACHPCVRIVFSSGLRWATELSIGVILMWLSGRAGNRRTQMEPAIVRVTQNRGQPLKSTG